ncbi:hypothetical protein BDF21DRAFT_414636 [Thamnidium elegans]|uniref:Secreted protein n=1 Tax=Thamnidium elegans TaxID=101142 RepID=A0A8H7VUE2_9FUNG|nr:hypothetical protein INT48_000348 [Thamnidium elegans]KAI8087539.1 hypothetical protein BDF21DRAFT_414636 [Thamnidium elegans]
MVSFTLFKSVSLLTLISSLVSAAPTKDVCDGFRVTSPHSFFTTTAGQCYQVSYDFGASSPAHPATVTVDIYEYKTDKFISNVVKKVTANGIATPWFNVDLGSTKKTGDYYFLITYGDKCKPIKSTYFNVIYNKNSPPAVCPN